QWLPSLTHPLSASLSSDPSPPQLYTLSLHDALPIWIQSALTGHLVLTSLHGTDAAGALERFLDLGIEPFLVASSVIGVVGQERLDRKSTRLNSSHQIISYAVFCLKKKNATQIDISLR